MNYKAKRYRSGLTTYTIAKELGIDWRKYQDVESKKINLEGEYLDKFLKITEPKNAKMIRFNRNQRIRDIKTFIKEGKLKELMGKRNYNAMTLARILDFDATTMSQILNGTYTSDDTNEFVYDFLNNPINAYVDESDVKIQEPKKETHRQADDDIHEELKKLKEEKGFTCQDISNGTGIPTSTISHILSGRKAKKVNIQKIQDFLTNSEAISHNTAELEKILKEKKLSKMDVAKALKINYAYVYNFLKGANIKKEYKKLITDYIMNAEGKKVRKNEPFELNLEEINVMIKDKEITYQDISEKFNISFSYIEKLLNDRIIGCYEMKRNLDEYVRNYEPQVKETENSEIDEKIIPTETLDEMLAEETTSEDVIETGILCCEEEDEDEEELVDIEDLITEGLIEEEVQTQSDKDYFELLKENADLKEKLAQAQKQVSRYGILIDIIGGLKNDNQCRPSR